MPLIHYLCEDKHSVSKFYRQAKEAPAVLICTKCEKESKKMLSAPSSTSVQIIDNGIQARQTEINLDIIEDIKERSSKDFTKDD